MLFTIFSYWLQWFFVLGRGLLLHDITEMITTCGIVTVLVLFFCFSFLIFWWLFFLPTWHVLCSEGCSEVFLDRGRSSFHRQIDLLFFCNGVGPYHRASSRKTRMCSKKNMFFNPTWYVFYVVFLKMFLNGFAWKYCTQKSHCFRKWVPVLTGCHNYIILYVGGKSTILGQTHWSGWWYVPIISPVSGQDII